MCKDKTKKNTSEENTESPHNGEQMGGIRLKLSHYRKKKQLIYKQSLECRESDTE